VRPGYEGGQMPIAPRLAQTRIYQYFQKRMGHCQFQDLARFESGSVVDEAALDARGLVKGPRDGIKLLAREIIKGVDCQNQC
jgi:large subunit ribosomal protein L15